MLSSLAGETAHEYFIVAVQPNTRYFFRVKSCSNGSAQFTIASDQLLPQGSPNENTVTRTIGGNGSGSGLSGGITSGLTKPVRFTVNPLIKKVKAQIFR